MTINNITALDYIDTENELSVIYPISADIEEIKSQDMGVATVRTNTGDKVLDLSGYIHLISVTANEGVYAVVWAKYDNPTSEKRHDAIMVTKKWLNDILNQGMLYTDGKRYSITAEKQSLLQAQLMIGLLQIVSGVPPENVILQWNDSGGVHCDWNYADLCMLSATIHHTVEPLVVKQQTAEKAITEAVTYDEIQQILQDFM